MEKVNWGRLLIIMWLSLFGYSAVADRAEIWVWKVTGPEPYKNVRIIEHGEVEGGYKVVSSFKKNGDCRLTAFRAVASWDDITGYVPYQDLDGVPEDYDREPGRQTLNIIIEYSPDLKPDYVEIRTRHDCGGPILTSRVFARFTVTE